MSHGKEVAVEPTQPEEATVSGLSYPNAIM